MIKTFFTYFCICLVTTLGYAQIELRDYNTNALITDGQTLNYSTTGCGYPNGNCVWKFVITNTSASDVRVRAVLDARTNASSSDGQLCVGSGCFIFLNVNQAYPNNAIVLAPGASIGDNGSQSFYNLAPMGTSAAMSWTFRFQAYDASDNEIGSPISVTYNYDSTLSSSEFNLSDLKIYTNQTNKTLNVNTPENLKVNIYNILGKRVKSADITSQNNQVSVSDLSSQIYIVRLTDNNGKSVTKKIVIE